MPGFALSSSAGLAVVSGSVASSPTAIAATAGSTTEEPTPTTEPGIIDAITQFLQNKAEHFKGEGTGKALVPEGIGGLKGFLAKLLAGTVGANTIGQLIPVIPPAAFYGGGYLFWRTVLLPRTTLSPVPWWVRGGRVLFSPPALLITLGSTLLFKWVFPRTSGESFVYPILRGLLTVGESEVPSLSDIERFLADLLDDTFFDIRAPGLPPRLGLGDLLDLIPVWKRDP